MIASEFTRTDDVLTGQQLAEYLGDDDLRDVIPVCSGEWRKEPGTADYRWRFWEDATMGD